MSRYYQAQPKPHRTGVTQPDTGPPVGTMGAIDTAGYAECRFDIALSGQGIQRLKLVLLFYNSRSGGWFEGAEYEFSSAGQFAVSARTRGATIFLMTKEFTGTSFELSADYAMS
ncbi:MAG: hypothetical protein JW954_01235 [Dehalococcoidaceae bacterium]|nr:hypothetical protein [Dehalococcoidaceae bacterium]